MFLHRILLCNSFYGKILPPPEWVVKQSAEKDEHLCFLWYIVEYEQNRFS